MNTILATLEALLAACYNDDVIITNGLYVGEWKILLERKILLSGNINDVIRKLYSNPELANASLDPNGVRATTRHGFPCLELFARLYNG